MKTAKDHLVELERKYEEYNRLIDNKDSIEVEGSLSIEDKKGNPVYYHVFYSGLEKIKNYIPKSSMEFIRKLAQKPYDIKIKAMVKRTLQYVKKLNRVYDHNQIDNYYNSLTKHRRNVTTPLVPTWEMHANAWSKQKYKSNPYEHTTIIYTRKGEIVRSKSERLIADILFELKIPYRIEPELRLKNGEIVYPDFLIFNRNCEEIYIEHFGMLDELLYVNKTVKKISNYTQSGFIQGKNIFYTFETSTNPLNQNDVYKLLKEHFLWFLIIIEK